MGKKHLSTIVLAVLISLSTQTCQPPSPQREDPALPLEPIEADLPSGTTVRGGEWIADAEPLGEIVFDVSSDGQEVTLRAFRFTGFACGGVTADGTASPSSTAGAPIRESQFRLESEVGPFRMLIEGGFDAASQSAQGVWQAAFQGAMCSGEWLAE